MCSYSRSVDLRVWLWHKEGDLGDPGKFFLEKLFLIWRPQGVEGLASGLDKDVYQAEASAQILKWEKVYRLGLMKDHQCYKKNLPRNRATQAPGRAGGQGPAPTSPLQGFKMYLKNIRKHQATLNHPQYSGAMAMMKSQKKELSRYSLKWKKIFSKLSMYDSASILCLSFTCHWSHCLSKGSGIFCGQA